MRRLSSPIRPRVARWYTLAVTVVGLAAIAATWLVPQMRPMRPWLPAVVGIAMVVSRAIGAPILVPRRMLDEAWLDRDELLLRRGNQSVQIPLRAVASVEIRHPGDPVTLTVGIPCILGDVVCFRAPPRSGFAIRDELRHALHAAAATTA